MSRLFMQCLNKNETLLRWWSTYVKCQYYYDVLDHLVIRNTIVIFLLSKL